MSVENSASNRFGELDCWFIDRYLRHDGETLEEAKIRVAAEQDARANESVGMEQETKRRRNKQRRNRI